MNNVTQLLNALSRGESQAAELLLPLVYDELRRLAAQKLAHEKPGQTLDATALVHEAYLRLAGGDGQSHFDGRGHMLWRCRTISWHHGRSFDKFAKSARTRR